MKTYFGNQTQQALHNFPFNFPPVQKELIYAIATIKKATASAHEEAGELSSQKTECISFVVDEILLGLYDDQFCTCALQGGAGTSMHMNVNEVIASRATELYNEKGNIGSIHPNDDVNMGQSTNDVNPTALRIALIPFIDQLVIEGKSLSSAFEKKGKEWKSINKLARTHIQDAIPTTLGAEMNSYASIIKRDIERIEEFYSYIHEIHLGGTAIGNRLNASQKYIEALYPILEEMTGYKLLPTSNFMSFTSSTGDFCHLSGIITTLYADLSKIAGDIRFMASGPRGGIGEISLQSLQPGSSIMPGKVNPVIPESINQIYYLINGLNQTILNATEGANMELGVMFPILADSILTSVKIALQGMIQFRTLCIDTMTANIENCKYHLERSTAYSTILSPILGYDKTSEIVKISIKENISLREVILKQKLMTNEEFDLVLSEALI